MSSQIGNLVRGIADVSRAALATRTYRCPMCGKRDAKNLGTNFPRTKRTLSIVLCPCGFYGSILDGVLWWNMDENCGRGPDDLETNPHLYFREDYELLLLPPRAAGYYFPFVKDTWHGTRFGELAMGPKGTYRATIVEWTENVVVDIDRLNVLAIGSESPAPSYKTLEYFCPCQSGGPPLSEELTNQLVEKRKTMGGEDE